MVGELKRRVVPSSMHPRRESCRSACTVTIIRRTPKSVGNHKEECLSSIKHAIKKLYSSMTACQEDSYGPAARLYIFGLH